MITSKNLQLAFILTAIYYQHIIAFNPSILQDSRDLPKVDGTFGFLYRTEDGIAHAAKGDANGQIHGRFSYTDPTGLKVNYNYNAGSRATPGYSYEDITEGPRYREPQQNYQPQQYRPPPPPPQTPQYRLSPQPRYDEPQEYREPAYYRPPQPKYRRPNYEPVADRYQQHRFRPSYKHSNEVSDEYY